MKILGTTATATVRQQVRHLRDQYGMSQNDVAARCAELGAPEVDRNVIANLESGRRLSLTVEELLVLAYALDVSPMHLLVQVDGDQALKVGKHWISPTLARDWLRGDQPLGGQDDARFANAAGHPGDGSTSDTVAALRTARMMMKRLEDELREQQEVR